MIVHKEFRVHKLNDLGMLKARELADSFDNLLYRVLEIVSAPETPTPNGREIALVRTHLELASFYAKKAMAQLPKNCQEEA